MLVALDVTSYLASRTGVGVAVGELARALVALAERDGRDTFRFCALSTSAAAAGRLRQAFGSERAEVRARRLPVRLVAPLVDRSPWPDCEALFGPADVFHTGPLLVPASRGAALVVTVYDLTPIRYPEFHIASNSFDRARLRRRLERAARIIVPSSSTRDDLEQLVGVARDRVRVVPLGVRPQPRPPASGPVVPELGLDREYILAVGSLEPRKNLTRLVRAFGLLKQRRRLPHLLVLVGPKGWMEDPLHRAVEELELSAEVRFTGFVSGETLAALYGNAALLVYPSLYEGFGLPPLEAMAAGCPVAVSRAGSLPEVVGDAGVYFDPTDAQDISRAILDVLESNDLRRALVGRGYARSRLFSWEATAEATRRIYAEARAER